ncbi:hypothetical protein RFI_16081, partial [Reticulomyxa filosa]
KKKKKNRIGLDRVDDTSAKMKWGCIGMGLWHVLAIGLSCWSIRVFYNKNKIIEQWHIDNDANRNNNSHNNNNNTYNNDHRYGNGMQRGEKKSPMLNSNVIKAVELDQHHHYNNNNSISNSQEQQSGEVSTNKKATSKAKTNTKSKSKPKKKGWLLQPYRDRSELEDSSDELIDEMAIKEQQQNAWNQSLGLSNMVREYSSSIDNANHTSGDHFTHHNFVYQGGNSDSHPHEHAMDLALRPSEQEKEKEKEKRKAKDNYNNNNNNNNNNDNDDRNDDNDNNNNNNNNNNKGRHYNGNELTTSNATHQNDADHSGQWDPLLVTNEQFAMAFLLFGWVSNFLFFFFFFFSLQPKNRKQQITLTLTLLHIHVNVKGIGKACAAVFGVTGNWMGSYMFDQIQWTLGVNGSIVLWLSWLCLCPSGANFFVERVLNRDILNSTRENSFVILGCMILSRSGV